MGKKMTETLSLATTKPSTETSNQNGSLGLGASLTGALRIALMKAFSHAKHG